MRRARNTKSSRASKKLMLSINPFCILCGGKVTKENASCEHVIPISKGGTNHWYNLGLSHKECNQQRGDKPLTNIQMFRFRVALMKKMRFHRQNKNTNNTKLVTVNQVPFEIRAAVLQQKT